MCYILYIVAGSVLQERRRLVSRSPIDGRMLNQPYHV
jgi:hypothetical protein